MAPPEKRFLGWGSNAVLSTGGVWLRPVQGVAQDRPPFLPEIGPSEALVQIGAVYRAVNLIARNISVMPFRVCRREADGYLAPQPDHPVSRLIGDEPNPNMTAIDLWSTVVMNLLLWGNAYVEIRRSQSGAVDSLWPWPSAFVYPQWDYEMDSLRYRLTGAAGGEGWMDAEDMMHFRLMGNGYVGYSPIMASQPTLQEYFLAQNYGLRMYNNRAMPSTILEYPEMLPDDQKAKYADQLSDRYAGPDKTHGVMVLDRGLSLKEVALPAGDKTYLESKRMSEADIATLYGLAPYLLGNAQQSSYNANEQGHRELHTMALLPNMRILEHGVDKRLLTDPAERSKHDPQHVLEMSVKERDDNIRANVLHGLTTLNEGRAARGDRPYDRGGEEPFVLANMIPIAKALLDASDPLRTGRPRGGSDTSRICLELETRAATGAARAKAIEGAKPGWAQAAQAIADADAAAVQAARIRYLDGPMPDAWGFQAWAREYWADDGPASALAQEAFDDLYPDWYRSGARSALDELGDHDFADPDLDARAGKKGRGAAVKWVRMARGRMEAQIGSALESDDFGARLDGWANDWKERRADTWSQYECGDTYNAGLLDGYRSQGVQSIRWVASSPCPICRPLDGVVVGLGQAFIEAGADVEYEGEDGQSKYTSARTRTHPPLHSGCQCSLEAA